MFVFCFLVVCFLFFFVFREGDNEKVGFSPQNDHPLHFSSPGIPSASPAHTLWVTLLVLIHGEVAGGGRDLGDRAAESWP